MFRKTLMLLAVVVSGCGVDDSGSDGVKKSSLAENYGHGCMTNADCSDVAGASCNGLSGSMCTVACKTDAQCGAGTVCNGSSCSQTCKVNSDCFNGGECIYSTEIKSSFCGYPSQASVGEHCKHDYECGMGECRTSDAHPDGYCTATCATSADCGSDLCIVPSASATTGACMPRCESPGSKSSCSNESTCRALSGATYGFCF